MTVPWANLLTLARLFSTLPCAWATHQGHWVTAAWLFAFAAVSDLADGPLARRFKTDTALGGLLDHATDAFYVVVLLFVLQAQGYAPLLLPILIAAAFIQYALDSRALTGHHLRASWLGRNNGVAYFVLVGIPLIRNALQLDWPSDMLVNAFAWLLVISTAASMADRFTARWRARAG